MKASLKPLALIHALAFTAAATAATATSTSGPEAATAASSAPAALETPAQDAQRWAFVPILMSNAETGAQGGALVIRFLNPGDTLNKSSTVGFAARLSQKGQVEVNLFPEWYLGNNRYHIAADVNYIRWPADFYEPGNGPKDSLDPYLAHGVNGSLTAERAWFRNFSAGPQALFKYEEIEAEGTGGRLTNDEPEVMNGPPDTVAGRAGGLTSGLGGVMTYDGRDAVYWTRSGAYLRAKAAWYREAWGSEFDFDSYCFEARRFFPFFATGALGLSATLQLKDGDIPFRELSTADGDHNLRGIVRGKYRDRHLMLVQSEYKSYLPDYGWLSRPWIRNRLGYAVFAEAGQVAHGTGDFDWEESRIGWGLGLRYSLNPAQRMNIRVDIGFVDGTVAPAINIKEAF